MKTQKKLLLGIILFSIIITIIFASNTNKIQIGSTYSKKPQGYAAWYEYMSDKGVKIERWKKPSEDLISYDNNPITLLRIMPNFSWYYDTEEDKKILNKGNKIVILGVKELATQAKFSTMQESEYGLVKIETTRRGKNKNTILGDEYGAIAWKEKRGKGEIIKVITPYLAANAYQDYQNNFEFLAQLVIQDTQEILVDEYLHGYKDLEVIKNELKQKANYLGDNVFTYLVNTPLFTIILQSLILLIVCLWGFNQRFGQKKKLSAPKINNNQAYIEALSSVLEKAKCTNFIVEVIGKEEQLKLQKELGLEDRLLDHQTLLEAWHNKNYRSKKLSNLLKLQRENSNLSNLKLLDWLKSWQEIRNRKL
jgi:hypothetical protein